MIAMSLLRSPICHVKSSTSGALWVGRMRISAADQPFDETRQTFVACPLQARRVTSSEPSSPSNEQHMKTTTLGALIIITASAAGPAALAQDADAGKSSFNKCMACHAIGEGAKNKVGPELNGLDGRKSGTVEGYSYSEANKNSGITWSKETFLEYIKDPKAKIPGTKMIFAGIKNENEANNLWAFLSQFDKDGKKK
jgi:cytochrome c